MLQHPQLPPEYAPELSSFEKLIFGSVIHFVNGARTVILIGVLKLCPILLQSTILYS